MIYKQKKKENMSYTINAITLYGVCMTKPIKGNDYIMFNMETAHAVQNPSTQKWEEKKDNHLIIVKNPNLMKVCEEYLTEGRKVIVNNGFLTYQYKQDANGNNTIKAYVSISAPGAQLILGGKTFDQNQQGSYQKGNFQKKPFSNNYQNQFSESPKSFSQFIDDDIPF